MEPLYTNRAVGIEPLEHRAVQRRPAAAGSAVPLLARHVLRALTAIA
jgi:hypothetical protein